MDVLSSGRKLTASLGQEPKPAVDRSIGKGGNGTISIVYFKGVEFAVKRVSGQYIASRAACDRHMACI